MIWTTVTNERALDGLIFENFTFQDIWLKLYYSLNLQEWYNWRFMDDRALYDCYAWSCKIHSVSQMTFTCFHTAM